jgi:hypothetical protein
MTGKELERRRSRWLEKAEKADDTMQDIVGHIVEGRGLLSWSKKHGFPNSVVHRWLTSNPERRITYEQARQQAAHTLAERSLSILQEKPKVCTDGRIDPAWVQLKKAEADSCRWLAARINPEAYADRSSLDVRANFTIDMTTAILAGRRRASLVVENDESGIPEPYASHETIFQPSTNQEEQQK